MQKIGRLEAQVQNLTAQLEARKQQKPQAPAAGNFKKKKEAVAGECKDKKLPAGQCKD